LQHRHEKIRHRRVVLRVEGEVLAVFEAAGLTQESIRQAARSIASASSSCL
jgi:uridylate kinase